MDYIELPHVEKKISKIIYGTAGRQFAQGENVNELLDAVFAMGINTFDTARNYRLAERSLGDWIAERGLREQVVILTKCGHPDLDGRARINEREMRRDFARSSQYLKTNYFDLYLLHRDCPDVEVGTIVEIFNTFYAEGKVRAFGVSNWTHQRIQEANEYAYTHNLQSFCVSSPNFGLAVQIGDPWGGGCVSISGPLNRNARKWYQKNQMPIIAYSSLGRGLFSGKVRGDAPESAAQFMDRAALKGYAYPENFERLRRCEKLAKQKKCTVPQIAMAWIYKQDLNTLAVVSTSRIAGMRENIAAINIELSQDELLWLNLEKDM